MTCCFNYIPAGPSYRTAAASRNKSDFPDDSHSRCSILAILYVNLGKITFAIRCKIIYDQKCIRKETKCTGLGKL